MVLFKKITNENFWECIELTVEGEQEGFIQSNAVSIAQSKVQPECRPLAIYDNNTMVGFTMYYICNAECNGYWIYRMLIDKRYQSKGYGKKALEKLLKIMKKDTSRNKISIVVCEENINAIKLAKCYGFEFNGQGLGNERIMELNY